MLEILGDLMVISVIMLQPLSLKQRYLLQSNFFIFFFFLERVQVHGFP